MSESLERVIFSSSVSKIDLIDFAIVALGKRISSIETSSTSSWSSEGSRLFFHPLGGML